MILLNTMPINNSSYAMRGVHARPDKVAPWLADDADWFFCGVHFSSPGMGKGETQAAESAPQLELIDPSIEQAIGDRRSAVTPACSYGWWLMSDADLF
jgi:hypothetical protein